MSSPPPAALTNGHTSALRDNEHLIDALPYIDSGYDDRSRRAAQALIDDECKRFRPTKNYLEHLPPIDFTKYDTEITRAEYTRVEAGQPSEPMDVRRYQLPGPTHGRMTDPLAWKAALDNSRAQLEAQRARGVNLDLQMTYGKETWRRYCDTLEKHMVHAQEESKKLQDELSRLHIDRKRDQQRAGDEMNVLNKEWVGLVTKNYQIEKVCSEMEAEIGMLERKRHKPAE